MGMKRTPTPIGNMSEEELRARIASYYESCKGKVLRDEDGLVLFDKRGLPVMEGDAPLTVTGLALALGTSRTTLLAYKGKYAAIIAEALSRVEEYAEMRLFDKDGANGAKYSLQNNFKGWREPAQESSSGGSGVVKIVCDIPKPQPAPEEGKTDVATG